MLELTVRRTVTSPGYQVFTQHVRLSAEKLTPKSARQAIAIAFGDSGSGEVTCEDGYGYKVYPNSTRKFMTYEFAF